MNIHWNFRALRSCLAHHGFNQAAGSALSGASFAVSVMLGRSQKKIAAAPLPYSHQKCEYYANPASSTLCCGAVRQAVPSTCLSSRLGGMQEDPEVSGPEWEGSWQPGARSELQNTGGLGNCNESM